MIWFSEPKGKNSVRIITTQISLTSARKSGMRARGCQWCPSWLCGPIAHERGDETHQADHFDDVLLIGQKPLVYI